MVRSGLPILGMATDGRATGIGFYCIGLAHPLLDWAMTEVAGHSEVAWVKRGREQVFGFWSHLQRDVFNKEGVSVMFGRREADCDAEPTECIWVGAVGRQGARSYSPQTIREKWNLLRHLSRSGSKGF
jgi:hypothetical protein